MTEGPKQISRRKRGAQPASPQHKAKPAKKSAHDGPPVGILTMIGLGGAFLAYAYNANGIQDATDGWFNGLDHSVHHHDATVASGFMTALPFLCMLAGLIIIYLFLQWMGLGSHKVKRTVELTEELSVHQFAELTAAEGIGPRVSREAYRMLTPDYGDRMRTTLTQSLTRELEVSSETIFGMFEELVQRSGGIIRTKFDPSELDTPIAMMQAAELCVERAALERRAALRTSLASAPETSRTIVPLPSQR